VIAILIDAHTFDEPDCDASGMFLGHWSALHSETISHDGLTRRCGRMDAIHTKITSSMKALASNMPFRTLVLCRWCNFKAGVRHALCLGNTTLSRGPMQCR
jgi:hypothetical protein